MANMTRSSYDIFFFQAEDGIRDSPVTGVQTCALPIWEEGAAVNTGRYLTVPSEEAPANYVPAAAVIRRERALFGFTGRKEHVGGYASRL